MLYRDKLPGKAHESEQPQYHYSKVSLASQEAHELSEGALRTQP